VTGGWRKLHNEELRNFCLSQSIIRMIKSNRTKYEWRRRGTNVDYRWESQKERGHYDNQEIHGWIILKWILEG
jgi:hypothetical protein